MVKKINRQLLNAGAMPEIRGVVIHNDAGSMTAEQYVNWLIPRDKALGIAHYYITKDCIARVIDTNLKAWHTGHSVGNSYFIGYEVCQSMSASDRDFLANEDMTLMQATEDLIFYGLPINEQTVKLHHEFVPTTCPHRSMALHGGTTASTKAYFIQRMIHFASLGKTVEEMMANQTGSTNSVKTTTVDLEKLANEVINGKWGNGQDRISRLTAAGYNAKDVQAVVDKIKKKPALKPIAEIARLVRLGRYGNGQARIDKLKAEGYDPKVIQAEVDRQKKK